MVEVISQSQLPTKWGKFKITIFEVSGEEVVMLEKIPPAPFNKGEKIQVPLVRIHSSCLTGDVMGSLRCDCGEQRDLGLEKIGAAGGLFFYLYQEGRGIGLSEKIKAYHLQDEGLDTVEANVKLGHPVDARQFVQVAEILKFLEIKNIKLLTNNLDKVKKLEAEQIKIIERVPLVVEPNEYNENYLITKREKLGHEFS